MRLIQGDISAPAAGELRKSAAAVRGPAEPRRNPLKGW